MSNYNKPWNWKGGRQIKENKIIILQKKHLRADKNGYVREHILIAEEVLEKPLPTSACIHHIDGNPHNNSKNNLVICENNAYHVFLHRRQRALQQCGHAHWRKCKFCSSYDEPDNLYIKGTMVCHLTCHAKHMREYRKANYEMFKEYYKKRRSNRAETG